MLSFFLSGFFYIQPLFSYFHWRDRQAACIILLHVAWPTNVLSKSASDHTCSSSSESGLSRQLSSATSRLDYDYDCHSTRHDYCTEKTSGGAWPQDSAGKVQAAQEQDLQSLIIAIYRPRAYKRGIYSGYGEERTSRKNKRRKHQD
jgi:hypothetical protein